MKIYIYIYATKISLIARCSFFSKIFLWKFENSSRYWRTNGYAIDGKRSCGVPFLRSKLLSPARESSSLFFPRCRHSFYPMRQTPAFFDVAIVSAFYVSRSHAGHRSLFFDELPLGTRIWTDVFPIDLRCRMTYPKWWCADAAATCQFSFLIVTVVCTDI